MKSGKMYRGYHLGKLLGAGNFGEVLFKSKFRFIELSILNLIKMWLSK